MTNPYAAPAESTPSHAKWRRVVRAGLLLELLGIGGFVVGGLVLLAGAILTFREFAFAGEVMLGGAALVAAAQLCFLIGPLLCLAVPRGNKARGPLVASVLLQVVSLATFAPAYFVRLDEYIPIEYVGWIEMAGWSIGLAATVCFLLFLCRLARLLGEVRLAWRANLGFALGTLLLGITVARSEWVLARFPALSSEVLDYSLLGVAIVAGLCLFLLYVTLVYDLRQKL